MAESDDEAGREDEEEKPFFERLVDSHTIFIDAVKNAHPLAVMASFSLAIAAFTTDSVPSAQPYAISASFLFLMAYVSSFAVRAFPSFVLAVVSYISTAMGIISLFLVVFEFTKSTPSLVNIFLSIPLSFMAAFNFVAIYISYKSIRPSIDKFGVVYFASQLFGATINVYLIGTLLYVMFILRGTLTQQHQLFIFASVGVFFASLLTSGLFAIRRKRKQRKDS